MNLALISIIIFISTIISSNTRLWGLNFKPFNCAGCLAFWISIIFLIPNLIENKDFVNYIGSSIFAFLGANTYNNLKDTI